MLQSYKEIKFKDGDTIPLSNVTYNSSIGGWQLFTLPNCVLYLNSGKKYAKEVDYIYMNTDLDEQDWRIVGNEYHPGISIPLKIREDVYDNHGGLVFLYHSMTEAQRDNPSEQYYGGLYLFTYMTGLDQLYNVYINDKNPDGKFFSNAPSDYPEFNAFYNVYKNPDGKYSLSMMVRGNLDDYYGWHIRYEENIFAQYYLDSLAPFKSVRFRTVKFPDETDDLIFFQDLDLYDRSKWDIYQGLLVGNKYEQAAEYVEYADLDYYGAPLFNHIEELIEACEDYALDNITKVELALYTFSLPSRGVGGRHYTTPKS